MTCPRDASGVLMLSSSLLSRSEQPAVRVQCKGVTLTGIALQQTHRHPGTQVCRLVPRPFAARACGESGAEEERGRRGRGRGWGGGEEEEAAAKEEAKSRGERLAR